MSDPPVPTCFDGTVPETYERYLVPMLFAPYARDLAARVAAKAPKAVLDVAAGTGALTRELLEALPAGARLAATDLSAAMLDIAASRLPGARVEWSQADALRLPFEDGAFDAVACQFGAMFFPDRPRGFAEARRVLAPSGHLLFNVWSSVAENDFVSVVVDALARLFPDDPPSFIERVPHGYHDVDALRGDLSAAGFRRVCVETVELRSVAASPRDAAIAYCRGTPLHEELVRRGADAVERAVDRATVALADRFGDGAIAGRMRALVITAAAG